MAKGFWEKAKAAYRVADAVAETLSGVNKDQSFRTDNGLCQERGRKPGNKKCERPLKKGHPTCGHTACSNAYAAHVSEHGDHLPAKGKKPLIANPSRLKYPHHSASPSGNGTVMRQQIKVKGKWVWSDEIEDEPEK